MKLILKAFIMSIQFITNKNGLEYPLALIHLMAFPEHDQWQVKDFKQLLALPNSENCLQGFLLYVQILKEAEIITFAVDPICQNQGVGKNILKQFLKRMEQESVKKVFLEVAEENKKAYYLYNFFHFQIHTIRKSYYGKNKNAFLMIKNI